MVEYKKIFPKGGIYMQEIRCPKCGEVFQVDESGYAAIVKQVRDHEFTEELKAQKERFEEERNNALKLAKAESENQMRDALAKKEAEIAKLTAQIEKADAEKLAALQQAAVEKDRQIVALQAKIDAKDIERLKRSAKGYGGNYGGTDHACYIYARWRSGSPP